MEARQLLDRYVAAAEAHLSASVEGDHVRANAAHRRLHATLRQLRKLGPEGTDALRVAAQHQSPGVRCWAATHLLETHPDVAVPALQLLAAGENPFVAFSARMVIEEFRKGRLQG